MLFHEVAHPLGQSQPNSRYSIVKKLPNPVYYLLHSLTDLCVGLDFCLNFEEQALEISFSEENFLDRELINDGLSLLIDICSKVEFFCS